VSSRSDNPASLVRNSVALAVPKLTAYLCSFLSAPVVLDGLGLRLFGVWALTGGLARYGALLDLGVGTSLARYIAATEDRRVRGQYMAAGWLSVLFVAVALGPAALFATPLLTHAIGGISETDMRIVLLSSAALICCSMIMQVIIAYPTGCRRMVAPNAGSTIGAVINFVASVGSIALGARLPGYALANVGASVASIVVIATIVLRAEGPLPFAAVDRRTTRQLLAFSVKNQMVRVTSVVNYQTDKIVIALAIGPAAAGAYELANRVAIAVREISIYAIAAIDVELTWLNTQFGIERARGRYRRLTKVSATVAVPPILLVIACAPLLLSVWLSHAPPNSVLVLVGLSVAYLASASTGTSYALAIAAAEPEIVARSAVAAAIANVVLTAALAPVLGIWGVLAGTVVALTLGALAQVFLVHRRFSIPLRHYVDAVVPPLVVCTVLALPVLAVSYSRPVHGRVVQGIMLVVISTAYLAVCGAWAVRARRLPASLIGNLPWLARLHRSPRRRAATLREERRPRAGAPVSSETWGRGL
jgi:O-antigen/teichoic acid export membrane protein